MLAYLQPNLYIKQQPQPSCVPTMGKLTKNTIVPLSPHSSNKHSREIKDEDDDDDDFIPTVGNITKNDAVPLSSTTSRKRQRETKDEDDDYCISISSRHRRRRRRNSRSNTPSPSPSLGEIDKSPSEDANTPPENLPVSLDRYACLRCVKFLASSPDFECKFPARSTKCTRCTRLSSKCEPVSPHLHSLQFCIVTLRCVRSPPAPMPKLVPSLPCRLNTKAAPQARKSPCVKA